MALGPGVLDDGRVPDYSRRFEEDFDPTAATLYVSGRDELPESVVRQQAMAARVLDERDSARPAGEPGEKIK